MALDGLPPAPDEWGERNMVRPSFRAAFAGRLPEPTLGACHRAAQRALATNKGVSARRRARHQRGPAIHFVCGTHVGRTRPTCVLITPLAGASTPPLLFPLCPVRVVACTVASSPLVVASTTGTATVASTIRCDHRGGQLEGAPSLLPPPPFPSALPLPAIMLRSGGAGLPASDGTPDADVNKAAELLAAEGPPWSGGGGAVAAAAASVPATAVAPRTALGVRRGSGVSKTPTSHVLAQASSTAEVARAVFKKTAASAGAASGAPLAQAPAKTPEEEKAAKYEARLVMNRKSAKASRIRRASYLVELEAAVVEMEAINAKLVAKLDAVSAENAQLRIDVAKARQEAPQAMVSAEAAVAPLTGAALAAASGATLAVEVEGASDALAAAAVAVPAISAPPMEVAAFEASLHAMFPGMGEQDAAPLIGCDVDVIPPPDLDFLEDPFP